MTQIYNYKAFSFTGEGFPEWNFKAIIGHEQELLDLLGLSFDLEDTIFTYNPELKYYTVEDDYIVYFGKEILEELVGDKAERLVAYFPYAINKYAVLKGTLPKGATIEDYFKNFTTQHTLQLLDLDIISMMDWFIVYDINTNVFRAESTDGRVSSKVLRLNK